MTEPNRDDDAAWERRTIREVLLASIAEQRRARRWGIFFRLLVFVYLAVVLFLAVPEFGGTPHLGGGRHTALIDLEGVIEQGGDVDADDVVGALRAAFEDGNTVGVILRINSPGGSPVQAGYINDEIVRLRDAHPDVPLYAVISDICASGGYYIAAAADQIYADKASLVGSIGVLMDGFGFTGSMEKLGVERRLLTAGEHKGFLDPFSPTQPEERAHVQGLLDGIHRQFIETVKRGRGDRLKDDPKLYSGLVWTGEQGLELGLVDALGSASFVAREVIGEDNVVDFTAREDLYDRFARQFGSALAQALGRVSSPALR